MFARDGARDLDRRGFERRGLDSPWRGLQKQI